MWLEEAKKRLEDLRATTSSDTPSLGTKTLQIALGDAPRAYALLERVREIGERWPHANTLETADKLAALFRDLERGPEVPLKAHLEGKEARDAKR